MPKISVIMPAYNSEKYIAEAIESILNQTFTDFEFIIIDDGSTDKTEQIIKTYTDKRIKFIKNKSNLGIVESLNYGIEIATGEFIARMDADDISLPNRFEKQLKMFEGRPSLGLISASIYRFGNCIHNNSICITGSDKLKCLLLEGMYFVHPAMMYRRSVVIENFIRYRKEYQYAEDYKFVSDMANCCEIDNYQEVLLKYREHDNQISNEKALIQKNIANKVRMDMLNEIKCKLSENEKEVFLGNQVTNDNFKIMESAYTKIIEANSLMNRYNQICLINTLSDMLYYKAFDYFTKDKSIARLIISSKLISLGSLLTKKRKIKFWLFSFLYENKIKQ